MRPLGIGAVCRQLFSAAGGRVFFPPRPGGSNLTQVRALQVRRLLPDRRCSILNPEGCAFARARFPSKGGGNCKGEANRYKKVPREKERTSAWLVFKGFRMPAFLFLGNCRFPNPEASFGEVSESELPRLAQTLLHVFSVESKIIGSLVSLPRKTCLISILCVI